MGKRDIELRATLAAALEVAAAAEGTTPDRLLEILIDEVLDAAEEDAALKAAGVNDE